MTPKSLLIALTLGAATVLPAHADTAGDPMVGERLAMTCMGCHAVEGSRNAYPSYRVPKIGGQKAAYLINALKAYRDGTREHATMQAQAQGLSDEEMRHIAAYFAQQQ